MGHNFRGEKGKKEDRSLNTERDEQDYYDIGIQIHQTDEKCREYYYKGEKINQKTADWMADCFIHKGMIPDLTKPEKEHID